MTGLLRDDSHFYSWNGGPKVPGVTSVLRMLDKSAPLVGWAKREVALAAVNNLDTVNTIVKSAGTTAAVNYLKEIPGYQRDAAANLGTQVHAIAEAMAKGQPMDVPDIAAPYVEAYRRDFLERYEPTFVQVEFMVYSDLFKYGGTADALVRIDGELWLLDYKTSKNVYSETALQLAGLQWAQFIGKPGDEQQYNLPKADRYGVVHIRPERALLIEYQVTQYERDAFRACRRLYSWVNERSEHIRRAA